MPNVYQLILFPAEVAFKLEVEPTAMLEGVAVTEVGAAGLVLIVIFTSSVDGVQGLLLMVQRKVYELPAVPVKVDVGLEAVVTVPPVPLMILHTPIPTVGVLAASVTDVSSHVAIAVWSMPA